MLLRNVRLSPKYLALHARRPYSLWYILQAVGSMPCRIGMESANKSSIDQPISQPSLDISPIWIPVTTADNSAQCRLSGKISVFCVGTVQKICLSSDDFYSDSTLVQGLIYVEFFFNILMFCFNSRRRVCAVLGVYTLS
jgi:hypothetical protein